MTDWQTAAVAITVLAAAAWLLRALWPHHPTAATGCGSGCNSCPSAAGSKADFNGGFVGLDSLQATALGDAKPHAPVSSAGS